jgi:hypothetical protein
MPANLVDELKAGQDDTYRDNDHSAELDNYKRLQNRANRPLLRAAKRVRQ